MELTHADHLRMLLQLLPEGPVWPRTPDTNIAKVLGSIADSLQRLDECAVRIRSEMDPRTTSELLIDWERNYGLPDGCLPLGANPDERRKRLVQKVVWRGGQSRKFFIDLVETLGYPGATIQEFKPFRANSKCNAALNQNGWRFAWRMNVPVVATIRPMKASSPCNSPLRSWGDSTLQCILAAYRPAHTILFVAYTGDYL